MLDLFRKKVSSIAVKALIVVIIGSFILVGASEIFLKSSNKNYVFKIGNYICTEQEWNTALNQQAAYISQQIGRQLTEEDLDKQFYSSVLNRLIDRKLILLEAEKLGMKVSDSMIQKTIMQYPTFQNKEGKFDKDIFEKFISQQHIDESKFIEAIREGIIVENMINSFGANLLITPQVVKVLKTSAKASKDVTEYTFNKTDYLVSSTPSQQDLEKVLDKYKSQFMTPEIRDISYISFDQKQIINKEIIVTPEELKEAYEQRKFMFEKPERRIVFHVVTKSKEEADKARKALESGKTFEQVMKQYGNGQTDYKMPEISKDSVPEDIGNTIFSLKLKQYSEPVKSPMGYHIFMVDKVIPAETTPYDKAKTALKKQLIEEKEFEAFTSAIKAIDGEIINGATLENIAKKYQLHIKNVSLASNTIKGNEVDHSAKFIDTAFSTKANNLSQVSPANKKTYFILKVNKIKPSNLLPFEKIKGELEAIWRQEQVQIKMYQAAKEAKLDLMEGKTPNVSFKRKVIKIDNNYQGKLPSEILTNLAFLAKGDFSAIAKDSNDNYIFIQMGDTNYTVDNNSNMRSLTQPDRSQGAILVEEYIHSLRNKYKVEVNPKFINEFKDS